MTELSEILSTHYTLLNGKLTKVFVKNGDRRFGDFYDCLLCSVDHLPPYNLIQHAKGRRHNQNANLVDIQRGSATLDYEDRRDRSHSNEDNPSHKSKRKTSKLQSVIDEIKDLSIVGLEYILDVQSNTESSYHCVLCQQIFDRISDVVEHLTSYNHRFLYLRKFFPKVFDEVSYLIEIVCAGIESQYSRFNLIVLDRSEFLDNRNKFTRLGSNSKYINKNIGCSELIQMSATDDVEGGRQGNTACVDTISISSDTSSDDDTAQERSYKLESFRFQMARAKNELLSKYQSFNKNPCSYPGYYQMWVTFWNMRISEFRNGNKFNTRYDWTSEWASEWKKLMNEKLIIDMQAKTDEIQNQLQIKDAMLTEIERKLIQIPEIAVDSAVKPVISQAIQRPVSPMPCSLQSSNSDRTSSKSVQQKTSLGLEQLLQKHKRSGDFLISWRELLNIFGIEDNPNSNGIEHMPIPHQTNQEPADFSKKQTHPVDVSEEIAAFEEHPDETVEQVTVISVLSLLLALENLLGILAPKVIDLLQTAIAMERLKADSSYTLLNDSNTCILFETIKEKFKGFLTADLVAENVQSVVRKAIDDMTDLVQQSNETSKNSYVLPLFNVEHTPTQPQTFVNVESSLPATANVLPPFNRNVDETPFVYMDSSLPATTNEFETNEITAVSLKDSEIKVLMTNFTLLSETDKSNFAVHLNKLRMSDPNRLARLKNDICENQSPNQTSFLEWERDIDYPDETFYSDSTNSAENALRNDKTMSIAYQVAQRNAGVKIKRRMTGEGDDFLMEKRFNQG